MSQIFVAHPHRFDPGIYTCTRVLGPMVNGGVVARFLLMENLAKLQTTKIKEKCVWSVGMMQSKPLIRIQD